MPDSTLKRSQQEMVFRHELLGRERSNFGGLRLFELHTRYRFRRRVRSVAPTRVVVDGSGIAVPVTENWKSSEPMGGGLIKTLAGGYPTRLSANESRFRVTPVSRITCGGFAAAHTAPGILELNSVK
jgi:hypothetical protein